ncbi:hypothetical protein [Rhizobium metallidurans]|uniref:Uncharacterized protein n=1 Tax=Rhizobium metallidurans TaxID=1265931 RepID=A0A7W6CQW1_9HYPH|nr:hypothetical protein [Rhizobium metallidurans]MBB3963483.1 hypothetical protein [Rhizobium metallidurans]
MTAAISKNISIDLDEDAEVATAAVVDLDRPVALDGNKVDSDVIDEDVNPLDTLPKDAIRNADGSVTLPLNVSVTLKTKKDGKIKERVFNELVFHRLVGADQRAIAAASEEHTVVTSFARTTRLNQAIMNALFDKMDLSDVTRGGRVLNYFLNNGPKTGA